MRKLTILFLLVASAGFAQDWGKFKAVTDKNEQLGQSMPIYSLIYNLADTCWYVTGAFAEDTDSLQTLIRQGLYNKNSYGDANKSWVLSISSPLEI